VGIFAILAIQKTGNLLFSCILCFSTIREIEELWKDTSPSKQELAFAMIKAVLEYKE
jgi:hypothetical protein